MFIWYTTSGINEKSLIFGIHCAGYEFNLNTQSVG